MQVSTAKVQQKSTDCAKKISRQERWKAKHMRVYSTRMTISQARDFDAACRAAGEKPYRLLRRLALEWADNRNRVHYFDFR